MLKSIDILVSLIVVLLALSMAVTVITQSITTLINSRGRHLRRGLTDMLQQLDPGLTAAVSDKVATAILSHPLVSASSLPFDVGDGTGWRRFLGGARLGNVVHREEFTKLLMGLACDGATGTAVMSTLTQDVKAAVTNALKNNGVPDPDAALKNIRTLAMQLERESPEVSNATRQTAAILQAAESELVAKVNAWFDQTMDRVSQRFTASTRAITFAGAFIVAFGLQVDTPMLFNRLSADDVLREKLVMEARTLPLMETPATTSAGTSGATASEFDRKYRKFLSEAGIISLPTGGWKDWVNGFQPGRLWGMLVTALLLTFGAPFWYATLGNLLQLRSILAVKDDAQRKDRQETDKSSTSAAPAKNATPTPIAGERDDRAATE